MYNICFGKIRGSGCLWGASLEGRRVAEVVWSETMRFFEVVSAN